MGQEDQILGMSVVLGVIVGVLHLLSVVSSSSKKVASGVSFLATFLSVAVALVFFFALIDLPTDGENTEIVGLTIFWIAFSLFGIGKTIAMAK